MKEASYNIYPPLLGHIKNWYSEVDRIESMGFVWIYINPITYPGFSGSLYACKDYYSYNENYFSSKDRKVAEKEIKSFTTYCKKKNIKVMMDLVINHSSKDSVLVDTHKDWYKADENGNLVSPGAWDNGEWVCWGDLASFDNSADKKDLWAYWLELIEYNISLGFSGFRCDAAYKVPSELWKYLIEKSKKINRDVIFFAESLGCSFEDTLLLTESGFDYVASSARWWDFKGDWFLDSYNKVREKTKQIAFPENHDTLRCITEYDGNIFRVKQMAIFTAIVSDMWMVTTGYEYGFFNRCNVVSDRPKNYEKIHYDISVFIKDLIKFVQSNDILSSCGKIVCLDLLDKEEIKKIHNEYIDTNKNITEDEKKSANDEYEKKVKDVDDRIIRRFYKYSMDEKNRVFILVNTSSSSQQFVGLKEFRIKEDISFENRIGMIDDKIILLPYEIKIFLTL